MKVAIMGCGPGGSYLYSLLRQRKPEVEIDLFDAAHHTRCGIKGCGWAISYPKFLNLCQEVDVNPEKFLLGRYDQAFIGQRSIKVDMGIIDKPLFIRDMLCGEKPMAPPREDLATYDRIIDATGTQRAYLAPYQSSLILDLIQIRATVSSAVPMMVFVNFKSVGYSWVFPLTDNEVHIGCGFVAGIEPAKQEVERVKQRISINRVLCSCHERIRCHGPILPFTEGNIWGLGACCTNPFHKLSVMLR